MRRKFSLLLAAATTLGLSAAHAQDQKPAKPNQQPQMGRGMGDMMQGGMMGQMSRMMENCNKMMELHLQRQQQGR